VLAGGLGVGVYLQFLNAEAASGAANDSHTAIAAARPAATTATTPGRASVQERAQAVISGHKARLDADPKSKEAPALLNAMGNLYRQKLSDYTSAIQSYELLLHDYPEWEGAHRALLKLADCYERVGDRDGARRTYRRMMERFPAETREHQYAKAQLGE